MTNPRFRRSGAHPNSGYYVNIPLEMWADIIAVIRGDMTPSNPGQYHDFISNLQSIPAQTKAEIHENTRDPMAPEPTTTLAPEPTPAPSSPEEAPPEAAIS